MARPETGASASNQNTVETTGYAKKVVMLSFVGIRAKYPPVMPILTSADEKELVIAKQEVAQEAVGSIFGCPVTMFKRVVYYYVEGEVTQMRPAKNITLCGLGEADPYSSPI